MILAAGMFILAALIPWLIFLFSQQKNSFAVANFLAPSGRPRVRLVDAAFCSRKLTLTSLMVPAHQEQAVVGCPPMCGSNDLKELIFIV